MKSKTSKYEDVYYPEEIPDTPFPTSNVVQNRTIVVNKPDGDMRLLLIKKIIDYAEILKRDTFEIDVSETGFGNNPNDNALLTSIAKDLRSRRCFASFKPNRYTMGRKYVVAKPNLDQLYKAKSKREAELGLSFYDYDYEIKSFYVEHRGSINLKTKRGRNYQSTLFEILLERWQENGEQEIKIPKTEIRTKAEKRLNEEWSSNKLRSNLGHLETKIQTNPKIASLIVFDRHNKDSVTFDIKRPPR